MPEGDTIHQARLRLQPILEGASVNRFWARKIRGHRPRQGQVVESIRVHGKHLLLDFTPVLTLQVHLGLGGWWQTHDSPHNEPLLFDQLRRNPRLRLYLSTDRGAAACYSAPTVQTFIREGQAGEQVGAVPDQITPLSNLGPDLRVDADLRREVVADAVARLRARTSSAELIADALLDQEVAAGIGNVYKSEVLFLHRVWPFMAVGKIDDATVEQLFETASGLLWINSQRPDSRRTTMPFSGSLSELHGGVYVYRRWRAPCRKCQTPIERDYRGRLGRSTYWCPRCQAAPSSTEA